MHTPASPAIRLKTARRLDQIGVSEILRITSKANALKRLGRDVIVLGAGEPDFDTPEHVKAAAARAMAAGQTKYTPLEGSIELKEAIREKFRRDNRLAYGLDEIIASSGAKQVIYNAMMATLDPGDEVIIPAPYWVSYADIVLIAGGVPVLPLCTEADGFRLTGEALDRAITPATRWLILNSPSNPTGAVYAEAHYRDLADVLLKHARVWTLTDDIYEHILYDGARFSTLAAVEPDLKHRILTVNGVSKAYAMTGWRVGYGGGPADLIQAMAVVQSQSTSSPCSISQAAAAEALTGPQEIVEVRRRSFQERRDLVTGALNRIPGLHCRRPEGAFYAYAGCGGVIGKRTPDGDMINSDADFTDYLLTHADVAVVPGSAFGLAPYFRLSYATSADELARACARIAEACARLA